MTGKIALALLPFVTLTGLRREAPTPGALPTVLVVSERVLADLRVFGAGMQNEMILCLGGVVRGDTAFIERWRMPRLEASTPLSVRVGDDGCDPERDLATWHNHPTGVCTQLAALQMGGSVGGDLCYLSSTDIRNAIARPTPFQVVHSGRDRWCWWTLAEVRAFADAGLALGHPTSSHQSGVILSALLTSQTGR